MAQEEHIILTPEELVHLIDTSAIMAVVPGRLMMEDRTTWYTEIIWDTDENDIAIKLSRDYYAGQAGANDNWDSLDKFKPDPDQGVLF